jgi:hypothetical protein
MRPPSSVSGANSSPDRRKSQRKNDQRRNHISRDDQQKSTARKPFTERGRKPNPSRRLDDDKPRRIRPFEPEIPADVDPKSLPGRIKSGLRALASENSEVVSKQLVMILRLLSTRSDHDLALADLFAKAAVSRAGRVGVVRELAGRVALAKSDYARAKIDLRAGHRILGEDQILVDIADAELGLGNARKALEILGEIDAKKIDRKALIYARIVAAASRIALGQSEAAGVSLKEVDRNFILEMIQRQPQENEWSRLLARWNEIRSQIAS